MKTKLTTDKPKPVQPESDCNICTEIQRLKFNHGYCKPLKTIMPIRKSNCIYFKTKIK